MPVHVPLAICHAQVLLVEDPIHLADAIQRLRNSMQVMLHGPAWGPQMACMGGKQGWRAHILAVNAPSRQTASLPNPEHLSPR